MNSEEGEIAAIVLAAGAGTRLGGRAKALLTDRTGKTSLQQVVEVLRANDVRTIVCVVAEPFAIDTHKEAQRLGVEVCQNFHPEQGMSSSIARGFEQLIQSGSPCRAAILWPVDCALVSPETVAKLCAQWRPGSLLVPSFNKKSGHPPIIPKRLWPRFAECETLEHGARTIMRSESREFVELDDPFVLHDIDSPADLEFLRERCFEKVGTLATLFLSVTLALSACGGARKKTVQVVAEIQDEPSLTRAALVRDLEATVLESYAQLTLDNIEAYADGVARSEQLLLVGVGPRNIIYGDKDGRAYGDRRPFGEMAGESSMGSQSIQVLSKNLDLRLSQDGSVAWLYDEISYRIPHLGREASVPLRFSALFVREGDRWVTMVEHLSYVLSVENLVSMARAEELPRPRRAKSTFDLPELRSFQDRIEKLCGASARYRDSVFVEQGGILLWPDTEDEYLDRDSIAAAPALTSLFGQGTALTARDIRVHRSLSGKVVWAYATLGLSGVLRDDTLSMSLRGTFVFELDDKGKWRAALVHVSAPITQEQLSMRVFGSQRPSMD